MSLEAVILLLLAVVVGAMAQRATGIGFNLVVAPACALALSAGVALGTVVRLALLADLLVLLGDGHAIQWTRVWHYAWPAAVAVPVAWLTTRVVGPSVLLTGATVATLVAVGVLVRPASRRTPSDRVDRVSGRAAGFAAGFMGVTTGLSGPPLALHTASGNRSLAGDRSTMAVFFVAVDLTATLMHPTAAGLGLLALLGVAAVLGTTIGAVLIGRVHERLLRRAVLVMVTVSATVALVGLVT